MITEEKCIIMDIDGTLCPIKRSDEHYRDLLPEPAVLSRLREYKDAGFYIILYTARNMRTYKGNLGKINANTAKMTMDWLSDHDIPYDEIHFGKPWQGKGGFYVDDKAIRPNEFVDNSYEQILELISHD